MQGRLLILDAVLTNRILLNAVLEPACYQVDQAATIAQGMAMMRQDAADLILTAWDLPDGTALDLRAALDRLDPDRTLPVIAIARPGDRPDRQAAFRAGLTDLLVCPLDEAMLQARLRSILRARVPSPVCDFPSQPAVTCVPAGPGFAEDAPGFAQLGRVVVMADDPATAGIWSRTLSMRMNRPVAGHVLAQRHAVLGAARPPDAVVVAVNGDRPDPALRLLCDLRAGADTRHVAVIAVPTGGDGLGAVRALDLGADDVMPVPFDGAELALRVDALLRRKHLADRLRSTVRDGLRAALMDPMTGLYNRRYALPYLAQSLRQSDVGGPGVAVLIADLDHFKRINDSHGHLAGDAVLTEVADRLRAVLEEMGDGPHMLARMGGEEFLIVLPQVAPETLPDRADRLRRAINGRPFLVGAARLPEAVTVSIGVAFWSALGEGHGDLVGEEDPVAAILNEADSALYMSKHAGRDTVTVAGAAA